MNDVKALEPHPNFPPLHPGELLADDILPMTGKTKKEIARLLGVTRVTLHAILRGDQSVTPEMAIRFGKLFGISPEMLLALQQSYDLWHAKRKLKTIKIKTLSWPAFLPGQTSKSGKAGSRGLKKAKGTDAALKRRREVA